MASTTEAGMQRQGNYKHGTAFKNTGYGMYNNQYGSRASTGDLHGMHTTGPDVSTLAHTFQGMNLANTTFAAQAKNAVMSSAAGPYGSLPLGTAVANNMYAAGQYMYPGAAAYSSNQQYQMPAMYEHHASQYMQHMHGQGYQQQDNSPLSQNWTPTTHATGEVPTLITPRRDSISSNENEIQPGTPSYAGYPNYNQAGVIINRSPSGIFAHTTPSPTSMLGPYGMPMVKQPEPCNISPRLQLLVSREPAIPRAIPAPSSPLKPLDRALENQRGETNVYIRGLLPETTDEMLEAWGARFGDIKSSKSIIDHNTGLCKGFGFVKYHNYDDANSCIRGFHFLGYEVSFARESFYSKLKTFADEGNTNLYVSNLPKSMNEHELATIFAPHKVCSARILRDKNGIPRGVGFARFESRDDCEEVIKTFNNAPIKGGDEDLLIQIRYADTQEQKALKQQTAAARQFRSAEYEFATQAWRNTARVTPYSATGQEKNTANEFESFLGTVPSVPIQGQRWAQSAAQQMPRSPLGDAPYSGTRVNNPQHSLVQINVAPASEGQATSGAEAVTDSKLATEPIHAHGDNSPVDSANVSE